MNDNFELDRNNDEVTKDGKKIAFLFVGIATLVVAIAGATFAYFQVTVTNDEDIEGESGYVASALTMTITHDTNSTVGTKKLIPQLDSGMATATNTTYKCVDANGNAVCKIFKIVLSNTTDTKFYVTGTLQLSDNDNNELVDSMPNLKWMQCSGANTCTGTTYNLKSTTSFINNAELAGKTSATYYVVVWISEQNSAQTDNGSFNGTVSFTGYNDANQTSAGVTSTIRS